MISLNAGFLLLWTFLTGGQGDLIRSISVNADFFTTDQKENIYFVYDENNLKLIRHEDGQSYVFGTKKYGTLKYVDATSPLKILLFFPDYVTIVVLDNTLADNGAYDLQSLGIIRVGAVALSFDNNVWLYDELDFRLKKINARMSVINESVRLQNIIATDVRINFLTERNGWLYANTLEHGILVFDIYATYHKTIPIRGLERFQVINDNIIYQERDSLVSFNMKTLERVTAPIPESNDIRQVRVQGNKMYVLRAKKMDVYNLK